MAMTKEEFEELKKSVEERILGVFLKLNSKILTTTQIREEINLSHQTLLKKLGDMEGLGYLKKVTFAGSRVNFWEKLV